MAAAVRRLGGRTGDIIVVSVFVGLVLILTAVLYLPSRSKRADAIAWSQAASAAASINDYVTTKHKLPDAISATSYKAKLPAGATYHKDSDQAYTFCVSYKRAGVIDLSDTRDMGDILDDSLLGTNYDGYGSINNDTPHDYLNIPGKHTAGKNCQTIRPRLTPEVQALSQAKNGHTVVCGTEVFSYLARGGVLSKEVVNVGLNNSPTLQPVTMVKVNYSNIPGDAGGMTYMYGPTSKAYGQDCNPLTVDALHVGDTVEVYDVVTPENGSVDIFLKR